MRSHDIMGREGAGQASPSGATVSAGTWLPALGHLAVGYAIASRAARTSSAGGRSVSLLFVLIVVAAVIPDLDIPLEDLGLAEHRGASHSIGVAAITGGAVGLIARWSSQSSRLWGVAAFLSMASHGLLDLFSEGPGVKLLWPFTDTLFAAAIRPLPTPQIFDLLSAPGLLVVAAEIALFAPLVLLSVFAASRSSSRRRRS